MTEAKDRIDYQQSMNNKRIKPDVDMTDGGYKFGEEMAEDCEIQAETDISLDQLRRDFAPHAKDCHCRMCLKAIIDRQAKELKVKDAALRQAMACRYHKGLCEVCHLACGKALKGKD